MSSTPRPSRRPARATTLRAACHALRIEAPVGQVHRLRQRAQAEVERGAHRARSNALQGAGEPRACCGIGRHRLEQTREPRLLGGEQLPNPRHQVLAGARGERAHGLVAEDRLEHALADRRGAARDRDLRAGQPTRLREDGDHHREPRAVDAERGQAGRRALARALVLHELEDMPLPRPHGGLRAPAQLARDGVHADRVLQQRAPGGPAAPAPGGALRGPVGGGRDHRIDAGADRRLSSASPVGLPVTSARRRSRSRPTPRSSARMKSPVPTTSCQRASTSPRSSAPLRTVSSTSSTALA